MLSRMTYFKTAWATKCIMYSTHAWPKAEDMVKVLVLVRAGQTSSDFYHV